MISRRSVYFRLDWDCQSILDRYLASYNECLTPMLTSVEFLQEMEEGPTAQQLTSQESKWIQIGSIAWLKRVVSELSLDENAL